MTLTAGTRFGPYEIIDQIGAGGMGVVYRATDTNLKREVAIKVLPESFATDAARLVRFQREAELLASLNHPNIAQIYGLEKADGATALVMELIDGPTLADRIEQGALPADEALGIAMQIAEALKGAHGQGIVHRDLKPANVKLRPDGTVKVLDFGIAKALEPESLTTEPQSPMLTTPATQVGVILGTAAYMSPEQARGLQVDQRADIWAFGCVLYEMLTGQPAFGGEDVTITLARIAIDDTDFDSIPAGVSPAVRQTIKLCLEKDVEKRLHAIGDVRLALEGAFETASPAAIEIAGVTRPIWDRPLPVAAAAVLVTGIIVGLIGEALRPEPVPRPVNRFDYDLPDGQSFRNTGRPVMALSPDGRHFAYNTTEGLYLRSMDALVARLVPGTELDSRSPEFSPDGESVAYYNQEAAELRRSAISGGAPVVIGPVERNVFGVSWGTDGTILLGQPEGILRVPATGGTPELIVEIDDNMAVYGPRLLPDGDTVLFSIGPQAQWDAAQIVVQSLSTGERTVLVNGGNDARYVSTGHLVYALNDGLFAVAFDLGSLSVSGGAVPLVQGVMRGGGTTGAANYGISDDGTLVYVTGSGTAGLRTPVWVDRQGREEPIAAEGRNHFNVRLSPDGRRFASTIPEGGNGDIWVHDLERDTSSRLTFDPAFDSRPVWTPDGERIVFSSGREEPGMFWRASDGTGQVERLTASEIIQRPETFSPDGTRLVFRQENQASDLYILTIDGEITSEPLLVTEFDEDESAISPDGRWVAYVSNETGRREAYVRPFPNFEDGKWQISRDGAADPFWGPASNELFYRQDAAVMAVSVETEPTFSAGTPSLLFTGDYSTLAGGFPSYSVSPDGERFLMFREGNSAGQAARQTQFVIVENWFEELERLAPTEQSQ